MTPSAIPLDQNPAAVYLASLGEGSRLTMRTALNTLGDLLGVGEVLDAHGRDVRYLVVPWADLRYQHTAAIRATLQERYAPATANKLLAALRRVLKEARRLGHISADDYERAADVASIEAQRVPRGRVLSESEITALMQACANDRTPAGARDAAILTLLCATGLRRSQVVALNMADYNPLTGALTIRTNKGQKDRLTYVVNNSKAALDDWLAVRGDVPGPMFYGVIKGGRLVARRLAAQAIAVICAARATEATLAPFTPHDIRRTFINELLEAGADIGIVQQLAGHEDPATTSRYDRRDKIVKQRAVALIQVPYFPRHRKA